MNRKEFTDEEREEIEGWARELADLMGKHFLKPPNPAIQDKVKKLRKKIEGKGLYITWEMSITDLQKLEGKADVHLWVPKHLM
ncbi:MAG: hypothetical protein HYT93_00235 [Parcubacteria group bacterium]|nr:hypothetical protein [Parcubacteria group bacterium]